MTRDVFINSDTVTHLSAFMHLAVVSFASSMYLVHNINNILSIQWPHNVYTTLSYKNHVLLVIHTRFTEAWRKTFTNMRRCACIERRCSASRWQCAGYNLYSRAVVLRTHRTVHVLRLIIVDIEASFIGYRKIHKAFQTFGSRTLIFIKKL